MATRRRHEVGGASVSASDVAGGTYSDGGGIVVIGGHVKIVPPWDPDIRLVIQTASMMFGVARQVKNKALGRQLEQTAQKLVNAHRAKIAAAVKSAGG